MNIHFEPGTSVTGTRGSCWGRAAAIVLRVGAMLSAVVLCAGLAGCGFLKPAKSTTRNFLLTPLPATETPAKPTDSIPVGLGSVKLPSYLFNTSMAVRKGTNEIDYLSTVLWAERLDNGLQRVLAANLATLLPTDQIRLSSWRSDDVAVGVYVAIERFDVEAGGQAVLVASWRILSPNGEKTLKSGTARLTRAGPEPETNPSGAVATLSGLVAELSQQLAQAIRDAAPAHAAPGTR